MKRLLCVLLILCLPLTALADVPAQVQAPDHLTLDPIVTNTGMTTISIDAEVIVPQVEGMNVYPTASRQVTVEDMRTICDFLGIDGSDFEFRNDETPYPDSTYEWGSLKTSGYYVYASNIFWHGIPYGEMLSAQLSDPPFEYVNSQYRGAPSPFLPDEAMEGCAYSRAEAEEMATRLVACIDPDLTIEAKGIVTGMNWITGATEAEIDANWERNKNVVIPNGYGFRFTRMVDGVRVPRAQFQGIGGRPEEGQMRPPFQNEYVYVTVTDQGIDTLNLYNGYNIGEPTQTNVELLPFDQIITTASAIFPLKYMPQENANGGQYEYRYTIHRISLNYIRVLKENNPEDFELVPVWDFWGTNEHRWVQRDGTWSDWHTDGGNAYSYLTIDARTGLVIDREYGY